MQSKNRLQSSKKWCVFFIYLTIDGSQNLMASKKKGEKTIQNKIESSFFFVKLLEKKGLILLI